MSEPVDIPIEDPTVFNVYPNITITKRICRAKMTVMEYVPFNSAKISVHLFDEMDLFVSARTYILELPEFLEWGTDDRFLVSWIKSKLTQ